MGTMQAQQRAMVTASAPPPTSHRSRRSKDSRAVRSSIGAEEVNAPTARAPVDARQVRVRTIEIQLDRHLPLNTSLSVNSKPVGMVTRT